MVRFMPIMKNFHFSLIRIALKCTFKKTPSDKERVGGGRGVQGRGETPWKKGKSYIFISSTPFLPLEQCSFSLDPTNYVAGPAL